MMTLALRNGVRIWLRPGDQVLRTDHLALGSRWVPAFEHPRVVVPAPNVRAPVASSTFWDKVMLAGLATLGAWAVAKLEHVS